MRKDLDNRKTTHNSSIMTREDIQEFLDSTEAYVCFRKEESNLRELKDEEEKKKCEDRIKSLKKEYEKKKPSTEMMAKLNYLRDPYGNGELVRIRKQFRSLYQNNFSKDFEHDHVSHVYSVEDAFDEFVKKYKAYDKKPSKPGRVLNEDLKEYSGITTKMCENFLTACVFAMNKGVGKKKAVDQVPQSETPKKTKDAENHSDSSSSVRNPWEDESKGEEDVEEGEEGKGVEVETSKMDETTKEADKDESEQSAKGDQKSSDHTDERSTSAGLDKSEQSPQMLRTIPKKQLDSNKSSKVSSDKNVITATNDLKEHEKKSEETSTRRESSNKKNASKDRSGMKEGGNNGGGKDRKEKSDQQKAVEQFTKENIGILPRMTCHHIMLNVFDHKFENIKNNQQSEYFVLVVYDIVTSFCFFRHMRKPYDADEASWHLSSIFGDFGYPSTVSYYDRGISFNKECYETNGSFIEKKSDVSQKHLINDVIDVSTILSFEYDCHK